MEEKILNYLQDSPHTWGEIVVHCEYQFGAARQALDNLLADGKVRYEVNRGLYHAASGPGVWL